jgi:hypothetical protein
LPSRQSNSSYGAGGGPLEFDERVNEVMVYPRLSLWTLEMSVGICVDRAYIFIYWLRRPALDLHPSAKQKWQTMYGANRTISLLPEATSIQNSILA